MKDILHRGVRSGKKQSKDLAGRDPVSGGSLTICA